MRVPLEFCRCNPRTSQLGRVSGSTLYLEGTCCGREVDVVAAQLVKGLLCQECRSLTLQCMLPVLLRRRRMEPLARHPVQQFQPAL